MIGRYETSEIAAAWLEEAKFQLWLQTELAVLEAKVKQGRLHPDVATQIRQDGIVDLDQIAALEAELEHDLLAFVRSVQSKLDSQVAGEFHRDMTSYDTEEIPTNVRVRDSINILLEALDKLIVVVRMQAIKYKRTLQIARTHGQHAEPITFGFKMLGWLEAFRRDYERLQVARAAIAVGKIRGAVGVFGELGPEIEATACASFGLAVPTHATQILHRDRIAQVMTTLAIVAGNVEHVAQDFRLMAQTEVLEVREPFGQKQAGSSRMPHKKNTIVTERLCGMPRLIRGYALAALEEIQTWGERDISQSSVERVMLPDTFHLVHYMLKKLAWVLEKMEVFPDQMMRNLNLTRGCIFSGQVKDLLVGWGLESEATYRLVQKASFAAMEQGRELKALIAEHELVAPLLKDAEKASALNACFDPWQGLKHLDALFEQCGISAEESA
ncbi:MAG: adenylosuccinate lyase [Patescibacteria group bacterium]